MVMNPFIRAGESALSVTDDAGPLLGTWSCTNQLPNSNPSQMSMRIQAGSPAPQVTLSSPTVPGELSTTSVILADGVLNFTATIDDLPLSFGVKANEDGTIDVSITFGGMWLPFTGVRVSD